MILLYVALLLTHDHVQLIDDHIIVINWSHGIMWLTNHCWYFCDYIYICEFWLRTMFFWISDHITVTACHINVRLTIWIFWKSLAKISKYIIQSIKARRHFINCHPFNHSWTAYWKLKKFIGIIDRDFSISKVIGIRLTFIDEPVVQGHETALGVYWMREVPGKPVKMQLVISYSPVSSSFLCQSRSCRWFLYRPFDYERLISWWIQSKMKKSDQLYGLLELMAFKLGFFKYFGTACSD